MTGHQSYGVGNRHGQRARWPWLLAAAALLAVLIAVFLPRPDGGTRKGDDKRAGKDANARGSQMSSPHAPHGRRSAADDHRPPEEIVAAKLSQFARSRRDILHAMARKHNAEVPPDVDKFYDAMEANDWDKADALYKSLTSQRENRALPESFYQLWPPLLESYGVAQQAHEWPAQRLLDYGNAVLGSLRPDQIYVGGTDPGRFIPTLMNETSAGDHHIVVTQNALADSSYLDYLGFLYSDQMKMLSSDDSQKGFADYISDAKNRAMHDQQFPNEPAQLRPGEDIKLTDGRVQASGQIAVMGVNEVLLTSLMKMNPDASFALEESFPLKSTYGDAVPLGPIMELRSQAGANAITPDIASQSVAYWQNAAQELLADPTAPDGSNPRKAYAKMASAQANLLADHNFNAQAEQDYRLAIQMEPSSPDSIYGLVNLLNSTGRSAEAQQVMANFRSQFPEMAARSPGGDPAVSSSKKSGSN